MAAAAAIGSTEKKYAVVTGSNKGIGFEICKKLASKDGITVVLTARDEKKGLDALQKLNELGFSDNVIFHQLDVTSSSSVSSLAEFVKNQFGRLDILINNAGVNGVITDAEAVKNLNPNDAEGVDFSKIYTETYELAKECFQINYYGMKRTTEAFLPLLQLSSSPRIVNVSSIMGQLKNIQNEWAKGILRDISNLTEERVDEVINELLKDFKEGTLAIKGWPTFFGAYQFSKVVVNAYTRILAKKYPNFKVNCVCPGFAKTDLNHGLGLFTAEEVAENPVRLALLPHDGPSGLFFDGSEESSFE